MKTINLKAVMVAGLATMFACTNYAGAQPIADASPVFLKEKSDISRDVANIRMQHEKLATLEENYRLEKKADNCLAAATTKKEIRKEKAELRMYRAYLRADKLDLISDHNQAINQKKVAIKDDECKLKSTRKALDKSLKAGDEAMAVKYAASVAQIKQEINQDKEWLQTARMNKNTDILAVNKEIKNVDGSFYGLLNAESAMAEQRVRMEK